MKLRRIVAALVLAGCTSTANEHRPVPATTSTTTPTTVAPASTSSLATTTIPGTTVATTIPAPDYSPPPGAFNPAVTQETIATTICVPGWTATIRPPTSYTTPLKLAQIAERHLPGGVADYEEDHLVPLELGGAPRDPANLWPEPRTGPFASAGAKDRSEGALKTLVCAGKVTLAVARYEIADPSTWGHIV